jgi:hypothetical protein
MANQFRFGIIICLILIFGVFFAGCSSDTPAPATTPVPTTAAGARYSPGDVIAKTASGGESLYVILKYDSTKDEYERAWIYKNADGSWGHFIDSRTERSPRSIVEKVYPVKVTQVTVSSVPIVTPTPVTAVPTTYVGASPVVSSVSPSNAGKDTTVTVTISGKNFQAGAIPKLVSPGSMPATGSAVSVSPTSITCTFSLSGIEAGSANIVVYNPDGRSDTLQNSFVIGDAGPVVTGITPLSAAMNGTASSYTIYGKNFKGAVKISFIKGSSEIVCINPISTDPQKATCGPVDFTLAKGASLGIWDVKVLNIEDSLSGTLTQKFSVTAEGT